MFFLKRLFNKIKVIKRACVFSVFLGGKSLVFQDFCSEKTNFSGYCGGLVIDIAIVLSDGYKCFSFNSLIPLSEKSLSYCSKVSFEASRKLGVAKNLVDQTNLSVKDEKIPSLDG